MRALGGREDLHRALEQTYTAHVTNMLQHVLLLDLFREIGGLILDPDKRSASLLRAFSALRDIRASYLLLQRTQLGQIAL